MKKLLEKICGFTLVVAFFSCCPGFSAVAADEDVVVTAAFDKREVIVAEEIHLRIAIEGDVGNVPRPRLPQFEGFSWYYMEQSSRMEYSASRKQYKRILEFSFAFVPQQVGTFTVGPFDVPVGDTIYRAPATKIVVTGSSDAQPSQQQTSTAGSVSASSGATSATMSPLQQSQTAGTSSSGASSSQFASSYAPPQYSEYKAGDKNVFLKCASDKRDVYPGEQLNIWYSLFTRIPTQYEGFKQDAGTKGFWVEDLTDKDNIRQETVRISGRSYTRADIKQLALFATSPGEYVINPGTIKCTVIQQDEAPQSAYFGSFFQDQFFGTQIVQKKEERELGAEDIAITVKPFPEKNKPAKFTSMVGSYVIHAEIDKNTVPTNEAVSVTVTVQGKGNVEAIDKPYYDMPASVRVVDGEVQANTVKGSPVVGWKKFTYLIIPKEQGNLSVGPFFAVYFNPESEQYQTIQSEAFKITVTPGKAQTEDLSSYLSTPLTQDLKKDVERVDEDIYTIENTLRSRAWNERLLMIAGGGKMGSGILVVLAIASIVIRRYSNALDKNVALKRSRAAFAAFRSSMKALRSKSRSKQKDVLVDLSSDIARTVMNYYSDKCNLQNYALTYQQLDEALSERFVDADYRKQLMTLLESCDFARFAPSSITHEHITAVIHNAQGLVEQFEKRK